MPLNKRKELLSSLRSLFDEVVCTVNLYPNQNFLLHNMDSVTQYFLYEDVSDPIISVEILTFKCCCIG